MSDETASQSKTEDFENMKVVDLKKMLKDIGLPITGNKSELVERLQGSILTAKKADDSNPGELESSNSELDSSLLNDCSKLNSSTEPEDQATAKTWENELLVFSRETSKEVPVFSQETPKEVTVSSPEKTKAPVSFPENLKEASVSSNALKPLKKRVFAQTSVGISEKPKEKKIVLNRNHIPTPKFIPNKPAEPRKNKIVVTYSKSDITECKDIKKGIISANTIKEGPNKIYLNAAKNLSENERIILRAKRFNTTVPEQVSKSGKIIITAKRNQGFHSTTTSSSATEVKKPQGLILTAAQERALRFDVNVGKVQRHIDKLQFKEMEAKRQKVALEQDQEKKKKRAERFGLL